MKKSQTSLKDIAAALNISISTVSRALRNTGEIHPDTQKLVLELAGKLHYKPNPLAMGLLKNQTKTIGVIIPEIDNSYFSSIIRGIIEVAEENGYRIITSYTNESQVAEVRAVNDLVFSRVDAIIACPANELTDYIHYQELIDNEFPIVHVDRDCYDLATTKIVTNNYSAAFTIVENLVSAGCNRIALITNLEPLSVGRQRYDGYQDALKKHDIVFDRDLIIHGDLGITTSIEGAKNLLELELKPDAIICNNDSVAMVTMKVLKEYGYKIPDDISVVGFSDDSFSSYLEPSLSSVSQPGYLIGMQAMEEVLKMIRGEREMGKERKIVLDSAVIIRNSTRKRK